ncbi:ABC transporter permease [Parapedobacter lycopersici]|uniref:ABC transporter permease n=1 Tax=Parapedobacter lycopersici TaxID=1864939 RepID=UPI00214DBDEB|nr:ABC transporter permease [Parapedobacter lycopersici]
MIKNYLKIAWRNLVKHKLYSAIKIGGFAFSIAACVLITLFIRHEISYDRSYPDSDRLYRAVMSINDDKGDPREGTSFMAPFAPTMKANFPEIEHAGRLLPNPLFGAGSNQVSTADNPESLHEDGIVYADQELLNALQLPMIQGDPQHALDEPNTVVLTATKAGKYFPDGNPVGKVIYLNDNKEKPYTIKGVLEDIPSNSHLYGFDFFLSLAGEPFYPGEQTNWLATNYVTYFKVKSGTDLNQLAKKMVSSVMDTYYIPALQGAGMQVAIARVKSAKLIFQPVSDIHLHSHEIADYDVTTRNSGDIRFVWLFGGVAGFILLIACVNFINLSTAKSASRAKEIGLRKVVGSYRSGLIRQFLTESTLYSLLSIALGVLLAWLSLPLFNQLANKQLVFPWDNLWLAPIIGLSVIIIGLLSGLYPAFYLSGFKPVQVLKGQLSRGAKNPLLRNGLVVFQFTTSIILIVGTLIINNQMQFILNKKIGFDKDQVMVIQGTHTLGDQLQTLKDELEKLPEVQHVTVGDYLPVQMGGVKRNGNPIWNEGRINEDVAAQGQFWEVDDDYLPTLGIQLIDGRNFDKNRAADADAAIINQRMAKLLNLENPVGKRITNGGKNMLVIGVVEDFNFESMRDEVGGVVLALGNSPTMMAVKLNGQHMAESVAGISALWKEFSPNQAIRFTFLDESYAAMYEGVQRTGTIFTCFAVLAIMIACLGLFGLAAFTTEQRTKEIGIRKVLGASVTGIVQLLSKDFIRLVLFALVIASPIAWWAMNQWLQDFAYRIEIRWWVFVLAGSAAVLIALLTVSYQAVRAAVANPVKSLRDE